MGLFERRRAGTKHGRDSRERPAFNPMAYHYEEQGHSVVERGYFRAPWDTYSRVHKVLKVFPEFGTCRVVAPGGDVYIRRITEVSRWQRVGT